MKWLNRSQYGPARQSRQNERKETKKVPLFKAFKLYKVQTVAGCQMELCNYTNIDMVGAHYFCPRQHVGDWTAEKAHFDIQSENSDKSFYHIPSCF